MLQLNPRMNEVIQGVYPFLCSDGVLIAPVDARLVVREVYKLDVYECGEIEKDDVVVDVGAHVGAFTLMSARRARLVVAVEPYPPNVKLLLANMRINRLENVIAVDAALGSYDGEAELYIATKTALHTISANRKRLDGAISPIYDRRLKVKLRTLDSVVEELGIKKVSFIKVDVEGAELDVLKGMSNTLRNSRKLKVAVATYHLPGETKMVRDFLRSRGFKIFAFKWGVLHGARSE